MDERKSTIRDLEEKIRSLTETRNRLFIDLGEALFQRIGDEEPFLDNSDAKHGAILADYRKLQAEIQESIEKIKALELDGQRFKVLEDEIASKEGEKFQIAKELEDVFVGLGKALLEDPDFEEMAGPLSVQKESLLSKIEEQEKKIEELDEKEGGIFAWLGRNAQMAMSKTLLSKYRNNLMRVYHSAGEKLLLSGQGETLDKDAIGEAQRLSGALSTSTADLAILKADRRKIGESFGSDGTPTRRINGLQKHISHINGEFPEVYLRLGSLVDENEGKALLSSYLKDEDQTFFDKNEQIKAQIADYESEIRKINAAISIDKEKSEIEKTKKAILNQRQKISAAENMITDYEKLISEIEERIIELEELIKGESGKK